jgi:DNA-binding transcriptional LysR family regulator
VLQGELDLGLVVADHVPAGLLVERTAREAIVLVAAPSHPLCRRSRFSLAELRQERFILPPAGTGLRPILDAQLMALGVAYGAVILELNSNEGIKLAVDQGLGLAFFVRCAVAADLAAGRFRALSVPELRLHATLHLVRRPRRYLSPLMQALLSHLSGELQAPPAG